MFTSVDQARFFATLQLNPPANFHIPRSVSMEMRMISIQPFRHGWMCILIDRSIPKHVALQVRAHWHELPLRERDTSVFRLTIFCDVNQHRELHVDPGAILHIAAVHHFNIFNDLCGGTTSVDQVSNVG